MTTENAFIIALIPNSTTSEIISKIISNLSIRHHQKHTLIPHIPLITYELYNRKDVSSDTIIDNLELEVSILKGIENWRKGIGKVEDDDEEVMKISDSDSDSKSSDEEEDDKDEDEDKVVDFGTNLIPSIQFKSLQPFKKPKYGVQEVQGIEEFDLIVEYEFKMEDYSIDNLRSAIMKTIESDNKKKSHSIEFEDMNLTLFNEKGKTKKKINKLIKSLTSKNKDSKGDKGKEEENAIQVWNNEKGGISLRGIEGFEVETIVVAKIVEGEWSEVGRISLT